MKEYQAKLALNPPPANAEEPVANPEVKTVRTNTRKAKQQVIVTTGSHGKVVTQVGSIISQRNLMIFLFSLYQITLLILYIF